MAVAMNAGRVAPLDVIVTDALALTAPTPLNEAPEHGATAEVVALNRNGQAREKARPFRDTEFRER